MEESTDSRDAHLPRQTLTLIVPPGHRRERLDVFLTRFVENTSRTKVQKLIESGGVVIDGVEARKSNYIVSPGETIVCTLPRPQPPEIIPEKIPLDIVYEDSVLLVVNKPPGIVVHPAHGNYHGTLVNALMHNARSLSSVRDSEQPGIVHRIDKDTSGLLLVAKTDAAHRFLSAQFAAHSIEREYWALVWGVFKPRAGVIDLPLGRNVRDRKKIAVREEGKKARTHYETLTEYGFCSLVRLRLETGRTHQIRVHLAAKRHPVFGDPTYGGRRIMYGNVSGSYKAFIDNLLKILPRQALHAKTLGFIHPATREKMVFDSSLPADMQMVLEKIKAYTRAAR